MSTELDFAQAFLSLLSTTQTTSESTLLQRPQFIARHPPQQPKLLISKKPFSVNTTITINKTEASNIKVICKSIKPPRFAIELECSAGETIYKIKGKLIKSSEKPEQLQDLSQLKFLIKGKVIQDSALLSSSISDVSSEEVTFTVMISEFKGSPTPVSPTTEPEVSSVDDTEVADADWETVHQLLTAGGIRCDILERVRKGWELTT